MYCGRRWKIREGFLEEVPLKLGLEGCVQICEADSEGGMLPEESITYAKTREVNSLAS